MNRLPAEPVIAVVGATGAVGRVMLQILQERAFPHRHIWAVATQRSAGTHLPFGEDSLVVEAINEDVFDGVDLVLLDTPDEAAREWAPRAVEKGAIVVDNSAAWRMENDVPLIVPEINRHELDGHNGIIASPNCTTITAVLPAYALHRRFGLEKMIVSSYQSVSGAGQPGVEELREQAAKVAHDIDLLGVGDYRGPAPSQFAAPIAFNVVPLVGSPRDSGYTGEELKLADESKKIMGIPALEVTGTCVRIPSVVGHGVSVYCRFRDAVDVVEARSVLSAEPGIELSEVPTPLAAAGKDPCFVGRLRRDPDDDRALWFFSAADNLRKGAALNAVQIAELLLPQ